MFLTKLLLKKNLIKHFKRKKGRNNQGKITVRQWGGGHKRLYRQIDWKQNNLKQGLILNIEYDPNRSNFIAKVMYRKQGGFVYRYIPCNTYLNVLQTIKPVNENLKPDKSYNKGFSFLLKNLSIGDIICNIEKTPKQGSVFARSAGTYGQIIELKTKKHNLASIQLPSKELYYISQDCKVTLGRNSNRFYQNLQKWKAGTSRHISLRSHVRGVAKNPIDHPHGGGEGKTSTKRPPVSPQGFLTKGVPTRNKKKNNFFIALSRKYSKKN